MKPLEEIGFYTMYDERVKNASVLSPLKRCELILTDRCNFRCPYCRGLKKEFRGDIPYSTAKSVVKYWCDEGLESVRFSGGEPTIYPALESLVKKAKRGGIKNIAISTNGTAPTDFYMHLISCGVNDFSVSLDSCCSSGVKKMSGGRNCFDVIVENIKAISKRAYLTAGIVVTNKNAATWVDTVKFASSLGVSDIRVISAAQDNALLDGAHNIPQSILDKHPILKYRTENMGSGRNVRGIEETDSRTCHLALDDMVCVGRYHFPCVIYMREGGNPIGEIGEHAREDRTGWRNNHNAFEDPICRQNCLDVCVDYNNRYEHFKIETSSLPRIDSSYFTFETWRNGNIKDVVPQSRYAVMVANKNKFMQYAVGWNYGHSIPCRPKPKEIAVMFHKSGKDFWFHMRRNEFYRVFAV